ncbi:MAG: AsmA family protein [Dysgonamonadaceae bacterium]|jgi:hypothetical protein|nr:AsmA family protein [Dysgonamonadaceae bacterium]
MKRIIKITGIILLAIILIIAVLPFAFKGKINEIIKSEANKNLNAKVDFSGLGLNFFSNFPNASVSLNDFCLTGTADFEQDTLFSAKNLAATVNLKSLFGNSGYEISKISLENARIFAHVLENGKANWDITKPADEAETRDSSEFKLLLKSLTVNNSDIIFKNDSSKIEFSMLGLNLNLSGDMTADETRLKTDFTVDDMNFAMSGVPYLSKSKFKGNTELNANLKDMIFTFAESALQLNEIKADIEGSFAFNADESLGLDLKLNAPETQFKDVLSLIPAIYSKDFEGLNASGEVSLDAAAKGRLTEDSVPAFNLALKVGKASFQYPGMPKSVTNINADINLANPGGTADNTTVDIPHFRFEMAGNPFDLSLHLTNPVSDPNFNLHALGKLNLGAVKEVYPLDSMELSGNLDANLKIAARMSAIEREQYDKVEAAGTLVLKDMLVKSSGKNDIKINTANLSFSPRYVDLSAFSAQYGKNDIAASGKLENFIPYFLKNETLKGSLAVNSNYLNLNDFMSNDDAAASDTSAVGVIEIPKNIDFTLNGNFKEVVFDKMDMQNVTGQIVIRDGKAEMKNVAMLALGGKLNINGYYDTGKNPSQPDISLDLDVAEASFAKTFSTFVTIQKLAPIFESLAGNYSTHFEMNSPLGADFMPVLGALSASGTLQSNNVEVSGNPLLNGLATALKNESLKDLKIKDLKLPFTISDGKVATKPFDINFGEGKMNLQGTTGLDQSIDYTANVELAGKLANNYLNNVAVKIGGTFTKPTFSVDAKSLANQALGNLISKATGDEGSATEQISQKVDEEFEKRSAQLRDEAKAAGEKLVAEAEKQGQKLIDEANKTTNALAKIAAVKAAETAAQKLKEEAQKKADQLNAEAEKQIQALEEKKEAAIR